jgi:aspartyl-tRNA(Asn)/glutamyl-tRNA(Gln) amidotransferase subunit C
MSSTKVDHVEAIDEGRVRRVALLSRLELTDDEVRTFSRDLTKILQHFNKLERLDLDGVEPTSHPIALSNVFRADAAAESLPTERALQNAPERQDNCFKVPQII